MLPAYMTALGTASSAATIPVTLQQVIKMGVDEDVADFCLNRIKFQLQIASLRIFFEKDRRVVAAKAQ